MVKQDDPIKHLTKNHMLHVDVPARSAEERPSAEKINNTRFSSKQVNFATHLEQAACN
jgi:hypothetical protein